MNGFQPNPADLHGIHHFLVEGVTWRACLVTQVADDLNPLRVLQLFQAVSDVDCQLLDLRGRPEDLLMTVLPVPPLSIRPSVEMDAGAGSNEEDITVIVKVRLALRPP